MQEYNPYNHNDQSNKNNFKQTELPQSTTILILGILSVAMFIVSREFISLILAVIATVLGHLAKKKYHEHSEKYTENSYKHTNIGYILGIIGVIINLGSVVLGKFEHWTYRLQELSF